MTNGKPAMTNQEIESLYKGNIHISHDAALRAVFDAGFACGVEDQIEGDVPMLTAADPSMIEDVDDVSVPEITTP